MKKILAIITAAAITAMAGAAMAAETSTTLQVDADVLAVCTAVTDSNIDFGDLNPLNDSPTSNTATKTGATRGQITVKCTDGTDYTLDAPSTATMAQGLDTITYTPILPSSVSPGSVAGTQYYIDAEVNKTAYESVPTGAYTGTLTVTVTY
jgi:spore coat protein U-like protein